MAETLVAVGVAALFALLVLGIRQHYVRERERRQIFRDLGFIEEHHPRGELKEALRLLHAPKAKPEQMTLSHCLRRRFPWGDLYYFRLSSSSEESTITAQIQASFTAYLPHAHMPALTVVCTEQARSLTTKALVAAVRSAMAKREGQVPVTEHGEFGSRALISAESEASARRMLSPAVQRVLMSFSFVMLECKGTVFTLSRPPQAGSGSGAKEEWRALLEASRTLAEEFSRHRS